MGDLVGIVAGHLYYYLKDIVPLTFRKDFLVTPGFVIRYLDNPRLYQPQYAANFIGNRNSNTNENNTNNNNNNNDGGFSNRLNNNNSNNNNNNNSNNRGGGGFVAFSGRGSTY